MARRRGESNDRGRGRSGGPLPGWASPMNVTNILGKNDPFPQQPSYPGINPPDRGGLMPKSRPSGPKRSD